MTSDGPASSVKEMNLAAKASIGRSNKKKVPKKVNKAEREKLKREQLNDLFVDLANSMELNQENNGKASILSEATKLLKDLFVQIQSLKKENASLLSESNYINVENDELKEEKSTLETQIEKLQTEIEAKASQQQEVSPHFLGVPSPDAALHQATQSVLVMPLQTDLQHYPSGGAKCTSHIIKPHARYPTPADSWPSQLLKEQLGVTISNPSDNTTREEGSGALQLKLQF